MNLNNMLKDINNNPISPDEMEEFLEELENDESEPSFERGVLLALRVFPKHKKKRFSIQMRMTALSTLIESNSLPGWVKPEQEDGSYRVAANIYMAAGLEPMIQDGNDISFDLDSLFKKAFSLGKLDA